MRLMIYGAGEIGRRLLEYSPREGIEILFVLDKDSSLWEKKINGYTVKNPELLFETEYDKVLLAFLNGKALNEVFSFLLDHDVPEEKIMFSYDISSLGIVKSPLDDIFVIPSIPLKPFVKGSAEIHMNYEGETKKAYARRKREGFFDKYCQGEGIDIGYNSDPITPGCSGWDLQNGDAQYLNGVEDESFDFVYSSHCLEHVWDVRCAIKNWFRVVRRGGYLIIAVPHRDLYEKKSQLPSYWNADHKHMFLIGQAELPDTLDIVEEVRTGLTGEKYEVQYVKVCDDGYVNPGSLIHSEGEYQIEMVIKKS